MRRLGLLLTLLLLSAAPVGAAGAPLLRTAETEPFTVQGFHFRPAERVTVRAAVGGVARVHVVRATSRGTFTTRFTAVAIDRCTIWVVSARGNHGSRATLRPLPFVDCAPIS